jgi:membrane-bound metal-dependent hydrolase YbcI (DUF457 family)
MDVVAHGLWAGLGVAVAARRWPVSSRTALATVGLATLPDLAQLLPLLVAALFDGSGVRILSAYAAALPGFDPTLPPPVALALHHLHCTMHSAVVAALVTLALWAVRRAFWWPLLGWWSHIVIDVFTHSSEYYPSPVLYPITDRGFDGIAWPTPWFMALNYAVLGVAGLWVWRSARTDRPVDTPPA